MTIGEKIRKNKIRRQVRVRSKLKGTSVRPRLSVFRSNKEIYAQVINDEAGKTLVSASTVEIEAKKKATKVEQAALVGALLAQKAKKAKVTQVCFDRGSYKFHGRVKALAEAARKEGLEF